MTTNSRPRQERAADVSHAAQSQITETQPLSPRRDGHGRSSGRHVVWWIGGIVGTIAAAGICVSSLALDRAPFFWFGLFLLVPYGLILIAPAWIGRVTRTASREVATVAVTPTDKSRVRPPVA